MEATDQWALGDLYQIVLNWIAERQREGKLSLEWFSVQSFNGDKLITMNGGARPIKGGGPYIIIYDDRQPPPRYEAHSYISPRMGWIEVIGRCNAADPLFFEKLLNDMISIQTSEALRAMGDTTYGSTTECS